MLRFARNVVFLIDGTAEIFRGLRHLIRKLNWRICSSHNPTSGLWFLAQRCRRRKNRMKSNNSCSSGSSYESAILNTWGTTHTLQKQSVNKVLWSFQPKIIKHVWFLAYMPRLTSRVRRFFSSKNLSLYM